MAKITPDDGGQRSNFCRAALANLKKRAEGHAKQHPTLRHMLVLPEGETLFVPARPGCHPLGSSSYHVPPAVSFGDSQVASALPPQNCWPPGLKPIRAVVAEQAYPPRPPARQRPYRVHLFFGDAAGMTPLQSLAADLVNLAGDVARAVFGARAPEHSTVFYHSPDCIHGKAAEILDAWLCTVHWWAWKAIDSPIHTRPHVVFGGSAIAADRRDQAMVEKMSFSALDCDIFTATAATIDLFLRFLDLPPDLVWPADYPPVSKPQEPAPDAESAKPQAPAEPRPTGADGKTAAPQGGAKPAEDGEQSGTVPPLQPVAGHKGEKATPRIMGPEYRPDPKEDWYGPMAMAEIARRLELDPRTAQDDLAKTGLWRVGPQKWKVRLDTLPPTGRKKVQTRPRKTAE